MKHVRGVYPPSRVIGEKSWNGTSGAGTIRRTVATAGATTVDCQRVRRTVTRSTTRLDHASVPQRCALDGFAEEVALTEGVGLAELDSLTTLLIRTENWMCPESCRKASWRKAPADWLTTLPRYAA